MGKNPTPHIAVLRERDLTSPADLHRRLKGALVFPDYYGENLAALADCLGDLAHPSRIELVLDDDDANLDGYLFRFANVCTRAAFANPCLSFEVRREPEPSAAR